MILDPPADDTRAFDTEAEARRWLRFRPGLLLVHLDVLRDGRCLAYIRRTPVPPDDGGDGEAVAA